MSNQDLDIKFQKAVEIANGMTQDMLPQDMQLRLYASYKLATNDNSTPNFMNSFDLRSAFKINAVLQISHLSNDEAKELYVSLINSIINENI